MGTVEEDIAQFGGMDAPTTTVEEDVANFGGVEPTQMADIPQKVYDPDGGKTLEVPGWYHPGLVGDAIRKNFHPEQEDIGEVGRALARSALQSGQAVGEIVRYIGDHIGSSPVPGTKKSEKIANFEKKVRDFILEQGDLMVNTYKDLQTTMKVGGVEMTKANPEIWKGAFMDNPSYTRGVALTMSAVTSLATAYAVSVATKNPLAGASALGLIEGSLQRGEAREAGASVATQDTALYLSTIGTTLLENIPLVKFLKGGKGKVAGTVEGFFAEGMTESAQQFWQNTIAKFGYEPTRKFTEGMLESFIVGAATGGVFGGFTSPNAARVDSAIRKLKLAGATDAEIETMGYNAAVHLAENSKSIDDNFRELMNLDYIPSVRELLSPEQKPGFNEVLDTPDLEIKGSEAVVEEEAPKPLPSEAAKLPEVDTAVEVQQLSENPSDEKTVTNTLPQIVSSLQVLTAKVNEYQSRGEAVPDSLLTRQRTLIDVLENLKSEEQAQPNPGIKRIIRLMTGQSELVPKQVTEMSALKASLNAQQRAAANAERMTKTELSDLKKGIVDTVKLYVPKEAQGKMLTDIATAEDGKDLMKTMDRMERIAEDANRKILLRDLKREIKKVEASSVIAIDYVNKIRDLVGQYELGKMTDQTRSNLEKTQKYIQERRLAGEDVSIPQYVLYQLQGLYRQSADNLDSTALHNLITTIKLLKEVGRTKLRAKEAFDEALKSQALAELAVGSKRMDTLPITAQGIEDLPASVRRANKINSALNWAAQKNLAITPIDVIVDMLDGNAGYTGPNMRIFKRPIDQAWSAYKTKQDRIGKKIVDLAVKLGLDETDFRKIGFYAAKVQEGGEEKLENLGYTPAEIAAVELNENQTELYEAMRTELDALRPEIAEVMRTVYNADLAEVQNYFPFLTDFEAMAEKEIKERFMLGAPEHGQFKRVNVEKKFTLQRTGAGKQKIQLDAMRVFLQHVDNAAYLVTVGRHTKRLSEIARSDAYQTAVGDRGQTFMIDWLDTIARKGRRAGDKIRVLDALRKNVGLATLGFRLSSVLVQPSSLMDGAAMIGPEAFEGAGLIASDKTWRKFVYDNMPEVKNRIGDDPFYMEFGENSFIDKTGRAAFWALQKFDMLAASSVAAGAYLKYMRANGLEVDLETPNLDAITYAQLIVRRSQASAFFKDAPQALTRGGLTGNSSLDRLLLQFQTFMLNRWSLIAHDGFGLGFQKGDIAKGANVMSFLILAKTAELGARGLSEELLNLITGDDEKEKDGITEQVVLSLLGDIPFIGQAAAPFIYGGIPVPAIQMIARTTERLAGVVSAKHGDVKARNAVRAAILILGALGVPGATSAESFVGKMLSGTSGKSRKKIAY